MVCLLTGRYGVSVFDVLLCTLSNVIPHRLYFHLELRTIYGICTLYHVQKA